MSAALFVCVHNRMRLPFLVTRWRMAWFKVNVLPVPKGPNTTRGAEVFPGTKIRSITSLWLVLSLVSKASQFHGRFSFKSRREESGHQKFLNNFNFNENPPGGLLKRRLDSVYRVNNRLAFCMHKQWIFYSFITWFDLHLRIPQLNDRLPLANN